jgi:hypothetical protein
MATVKQKYVKTKYRTVGILFKFVSNFELQLKFRKYKKKYFPITLYSCRFTVGRGWGGDG